MNEEQKRNFKFVSERYLSNGSIYKCLIFPFEPDYSEFKKLVCIKKGYWSELDNLSANYLDIYYIFEDYGYSGVKLMTAFESLDQRFHTSVPCIAIWKENIDEAKVVSIRRLSADDVYDVINEIVSLIRKSGTLEQIVEGSGRKVRQLQEMSRPVTNFIQNINGNANGMQNINTGEGSIVIAGDDSYIEFSHQVKDALNLVDATKILSDAQKCELKAILLEADQGVKEKSPEKIASSRSRIKRLLKIAGQGANAIISTFANLTAILTFFGLK